MYGQKRIGEEHYETTRFTDGFLSLEVQRYVMPDEWSLSLSPKEIKVQAYLHLVPRGFLQKIMRPEPSYVGIMQLTFWPGDPRMQYYFLFGSPILPINIGRTGFHTVSLPKAKMDQLIPLLNERPIDIAKLLAILTEGANPIMGQSELPEQQLLTAHNP